MIMTKRSIIIAFVFIALIGFLFVFSNVFNTPSLKKIDPRIINQAADNNFVEINFYDPGKGRKPFQLKAVVLDTDFELFNEKRFTYKFGKGEATIPLDESTKVITPNPSKSRASRFLKLNFNEAVFENIPGLTDRTKIVFPSAGNCVFVEEEGEEEKNVNVKFNTLDIDWEAPGYAILSSIKPVEITRQVPFLLLKGRGGLRGTFEKKAEASQFSFPAPVSVFVSRNAGSSILMFGQDKENQSKKATFFGIKCDGALVFDMKKNRLIFDKKVVVYPTEKAEEPSSFAKMRRFECHQLVVNIGNSSDKTLNNAEARRGVDLPVRGYWDTVTIESGKVKWDGKTGKSTLSDSPHLWGKTMSSLFDAICAKITMDTTARIATLSGPIKSFIEQKNKGKEKGFPSTWDLDADFGEIFFTSGKNFKIEKIIVSTDPTLESADAVRLISRDTKKIKALGGKLVYDVGTENVVVTGLPNHLPSFHLSHEDEEVSAVAEKVIFSFKDNRIIFENGVSVKIVQKKEKGDSLCHRLHAHRVCIALAGEDRKSITEKNNSKGNNFILWKTGIESIEAWAENEQKPLVFDFDGPQRSMLEGGLLTWKRSTGIIKVIPFKQRITQRISFRQGTLTCKKLEILPDQKTIVAEGNVQINDLNIKKRKFTIKADKAECSFNSTGIDKIGPPALTSLKKVVASSLPLKNIMVKGEDIEAISKIVVYDTTEDFLLFSGQEKQIFRFNGKAGKDELSAREVKYIPSENRLMLSGNVFGIIHQGNWSDKKNLGKVKTAEQTKWEYETRTAEVQFTQGKKNKEISSIQAEKEIKLSNKELKLLVTGDHLKYNPITQTITLGSNGDQGGLQTIKYGPKDQTSWLTARIIRLSRRERLQNGANIPEIVAVLSNDVRCNFQLRPLMRSKPLPEATPRKLDITADRIIFIVPAEKKVLGSDISYAMAEGHVIFKAFSKIDFEGKPPYSGSGAKAIYSHAPMKFIMFGDGKGGKAVIEHPLGEERSDIIILKRRQDGSFKLESGAGYDQDLNGPFSAPLPGNNLPATDTR